MTSSKPTTIIGIDPGKGGGIASLCNGVMLAEPMPETPQEIYEYLNSMLVPLAPIRAYLENVHAMPSDGRASIWKFARNMGHVEMALIGNGIGYELVTPSTWMKAFLGTVPKVRKDRKRAIKEKAQCLYPNAKITLKTSDAVGIMRYGVSL